MELSRRAHHFLVQTLQELGVLAAKAFRHEVLTENKQNPHDVVTHVDHLIQHHVERRCTKFLPGSTVFGEEDFAGLTLDEIAQEFAQALESDSLWIIDPIDGTSNFAHGFGYFALSVALWHRGELIAAVVHNPMKAETFSARIGQAYFQPHNSAESQPLTGCAGRPQAHAALSTSFPHAELLRRDDGEPSPAASQHLQIFAQLVAGFATLRRPICASLEMSYVAAGFSDVTLAVDSKPWDAAAGAFIAAQAGAALRPHWYTPDGTAPSAVLPDFAAPCYTVARGHYPLVEESARRISELQHDTLGLSSMNRPK